MYHVRGVVRSIKEEINAVRRELEKLEKAGILKKEARGNRVYYWTREDYLFYGELLAMVSKTTGLGAEIIANRSKIGKLNFVMFSGRFARRKSRKRDDDVDVLVVGEVVLPVLATLLRKEEFNAKVIHCYDPEEYDCKNAHPFLSGILSEEEL
jgi:hypothetical protein